ncbi:bifunctional transcriptional activator/DNA repair enzyme AdaA [Pelagibius sp. Alg239-R121]|uniref:bifunctional transcriptional activator/DNA repair enzyme AdaA n=1 Tax=Pelagibius sp. Alg239-R121 TaxID=2993448 RepID=UPI0024A73B5C|nr:methylated-DNA--[protein]-cysteine S-methyltransferase [Pelagibius sp. Alg239-R121]
MSSSPSPAQVDLVREACAYIEAREDERITLDELARQVRLSPWHFQRLFKKIMGVSPRDYAAARRSKRFRDELKNGESVAGATYGAGYGSSSRVYESAQRQLGMTPASYAKGGEGARIAFSIVESIQGLLLVAATQKGVCFVCLGDDVGDLEKQLRKEFPRAAEVFRDDSTIGPAVESVAEYLAGELPQIDLPLDVLATAFQRRVWQELLAIPLGETRSYLEVAEAMGLSQSQRAVANACARNPVALLVPCHRVIREDGTLGGYRWGSDRKTALLAQEAAMAEVVPAL